MRKELIRKIYQAESITEAEFKDFVSSAQNVYQCDLKGKEVDPTRTLAIRISTVNPDRSKDVVIPSGGKLNNYLANPVVAAFHNYNNPSVGKTVTIAVSDTDIVVLMEFPPVGVNPQADMLHELYKGGFQNAASIGFIPLTWEPIPQGGYKFLSWEMIEWSLVLVPDNPEAVKMLKSKGLDPDQILKEQEEALVKHEEDVKEKEEKEEEVVEKKVTEMTVKELLEAVRTETRQKDVSEVVALAYLASDLDWYIYCFEQREVNPETIAKLQQALELVMVCIQEQAVLEQKGFTMKSGRVISAKNEKLIQSAIDNLSTVMAALQEEESTPEDAGDSEEEKEIEQPVEQKGKALELIKEMTKHSKKADKHTGFTLQLAKKLREIVQTDNATKGVTLTEKGD